MLFVQGVPLTNNKKYCKNVRYKLKKYKNVRKKILTTLNEQYIIKPYQFKKTFGGNEKMKITELKKEIQLLKNENPMYKRVINEIIKDSEYYNGNYKERLKARCEDVQHGCGSGVVSSMIYYSDTLAFFKRYKKDILKLLKEVCNEYGCSTLELLRDFDADDIFCEDTHNRNLLAWFAYEEINNRLYYLLEE